MGADFLPQKNAENAKGGASVPASRFFNPKTKIELEQKVTESTEGSLGP
jgi:hypothetical protein